MMTQSPLPLSFTLKKLILRCVLLLGIDATLLQANILETYNFETGDLSQVSSTEVEGPSASVSASTTFARKGSYAMRSSIANADRRAEVVSSLRGTVGGENWYGWSIYIPSAFPGDGSLDIVSQFHDWHSSQPSWAKDGTAPTCIVLTTSGHLQMDLKYQSAPLTTEHDSFDLGAYTPGEWHDMVVHVKWTHENSGFMKIWVNGVLKMDYSGPTYLDYGSGNGPYFKMGNYKGIYNWPGSTPRELYMDEYRMGDSHSNYAEVDPGQGDTSQDLLAVESFDYSIGTLDTCDGGSGWASAWEAWGGGGDTSVMSNGFSYTDMDTAGNRFRVYDSDGNFQGISRTLATPMGEVYGTYWIAFMAQKKSSGREAYIDFDGLTLSAYQNNNWQIKTPNTAYTTISNANYSSMHLFLIRVDATESGDTVSVWVDPVLASGEPSLASAQATLTDSYGFSFDTVNILHGPWGNASQSSEWDELRIGYSFDAVVPAPETLLYVYEGFDYSTGSLGAADGGYGWGSAWSVFGGSGDTSIISSGFSYTDLDTSGNRFRVYDSDGDAQGVRRSISESVGLKEGVYWMSFLAQKNSSGRKAQLNFGPLEFKAQNGNWQVKTPNIAYTTLAGANYGSQHLFLVRMDASASGNTVRVWVDPVLASGEPAVGSALVTLQDSAFFSFNTLSIQHGPYGNSAQSGEWDEIRISETFSDVISF